ncbi:primase-helicase family protein [Methylocystis parvus]|uniref:primase-helicase family protein n=1 Tax=Methylocystis parvus TaxID=134 RepID=UPI003C784C10
MRSPTDPRDLLVDDGPAGKVQYTRDGFGAPRDSREPAFGYDGDANGASETLTAIELVRVTKDAGPLTKRISLGADGKLVSDSSQCQMARGDMERLRLPDWREFAKLLDQTPRNVAYSLGRLHDDIADSVRIVLLGEETAELSKGAPRSAKTISYRPGLPGLVLLDFDTKGMPAAVKDRLNALGGFLGALDHICPGLTAAGYIRRLSTSSGIYRTDTGERFEKAGAHVYALVADGRDAKRFLYALHDRAWIAGLGWHIVARNGALLERSIVDRSVCAGERLNFEATPDLAPPLAQQRPLPDVHDGAPFDTKLCLDLTPDEKRARQMAVDASKEALAPQTEETRRQFEANRVEELVKRGVSREQAEETARNWAEGVLMPDAILDFRNHGLGEPSVREVLGDPARYEGKWFADPIEGASYSRSNAIVRRARNGVFILSFAHGLERRYELRGDKDLDDATILLRIDELHQKTESLEKRSPEYKALRNEAIALFARTSHDYQGDPNERKHFCYRWSLDAGALRECLKEESAKHRRHEKTRDRDERKREREEEKSAADRQVAELNRYHFFVLEGGKAFVFQERFDPVLKRKFYAHIRPRDFETAYMNQRVSIETGRGQTVVGFGRYWLESADRRQYLGGVTFDPGKRHKPDQFNLWEGFGVEPKKGGWKRFRTHLYKVVCRRNKKCFKYLIRWLANAVQHPERQGEVVVVMRGDEGVGKGFLGRAMAFLFGRHGMQISSAKHLVGNFNAHLQDCCMLFADEAFFAGDKQHIGVLNAIVTERTLTIEGKGKDAVQSPNFVHLIMASNNDWVVPASKGARRYFVLDVSSEHKDDTTHFGAIQKELDGGGYEAMLYDLQRVNLATFDVRKFPSTDALQDQKIQSLKTEEIWLYRVLYQGYVQASAFGLSEMEQWHEAVTTDFLFAAYERYAKDQGDRHRLAPNRFGEFLRAMGFTRVTQSRAAFGGEHGKGLEARTRYNPNRKHAYRFGALADARETFAKATGFALEWPEDATFDGIDEIPPM